MKIPGISAISRAIIAALSPFTGAGVNTTPQNRYEAAYHGFGDRSLLPGLVQDARLDADASTRIELVRRSRYWCRNNAVLKRLRSVYKQYVVGGTGLQVIPKSEDQTWIPAASKWWVNWCKSPMVDSGLAIGPAQNLIVGTEFEDGECFIYKTYSKETGQPRIQLIEGHRIATPPSMRSEEGRSIIDGVEFRTDEDGHPTGRPIRYWMRTDSTCFASLQWSKTANQATWKSLDAKDVLHYFEPARIGMVRGLPRPTQVLNDMHDLADLQDLEMKAAKAAAEVANVITNRTGEANVSASRRQRWDIMSQNAAGTATTKQAPLFYEATLGGRNVYISNGEKFEQFMSNRPSVATQAYWDYLVRKICCGVGISSLLVLPFSLQGTVTRADLDVASAFFRSRSEVMAGIMRDIYVWAMEWAIKYDRSLDGAPNDWRNVVVRPPRSVTVDVGRNSKAILDEIKAGTRTFQDVCAEMGHDWRHVIDQKTIEAKYISDKAREANVDRGLISQLAFESVSSSESLSAVVEDAEDLGELESK